MTPILSKREVDIITFDDIFNGVGYSPICCSLVSFNVSTFHQVFHFVDTILPRISTKADNLSGVFQNVISLQE